MYCRVSSALNIVLKEQNTICSMKQYRKNFIQLDEAWYVIFWVDTEVINTCRNKKNQSEQYQD